MVQKPTKIEHAAFLCQCFHASFYLFYILWTDPMCMTKIVWLTMIPVVFVFTISIVVYKIVQESEQNCE